MKKLTITLLCIISSLALRAQSADLQYYIYGVDYTKAKVYAASESVEEFAKAFEGINMLFITEPDKYDFSKLLKRRVKTYIEPVIEKNAKNDYANLKTLNLDYEEIDLSSIIQEYDLPQEEGVGVIFIAKLLNKPEATATYDLVKFDIESREILDKREVSGKAKGFGLRNYWAYTIYSVIKSSR